MKLLAPILVLCASPLFAGGVEIVDARAQATPSGWRFDVTVQHADTGWDHYADGWEVLAPDGSRLGFRELLHPHVNEQPFTRALHGVQIDTAITQVTIRARDNVHGWSENTFVLPLAK